jgi:hypothetical protein
MAHLDETGIDQDPSAGRVHDTADDRGGRGSGIVRRSNAQTSGDANWGSETVQDSASDGDPAVFLPNLKEGETSTDSEALKCFCGSGELHRHEGGGGRD